MKKISGVLYKFNQEYSLFHLQILCKWIEIMFEFSLARETNF